jgi:hypothetical protein
VLVLAADSWAQSRPPIIERIAKTYGLNSWNQVEAIGSEGSEQWPRSCLLFSDYFKKESYREAIEELSQCYASYGYSDVAWNLRKTFTARMIGHSPKTVV